MYKKTIFLLLLSAIFSCKEKEIKKVVEKKIENENKNQIDYSYINQQVNTQKNGKENKDININDLILKLMAQNYFFHQLYSHTNKISLLFSSFLTTLFLFL